MIRSELEVSQKGILSGSFVESPIEPYKSSRTVYYPSVHHQVESPSKSGIEALHKILDALKEWNFRERNILKPIFVIYAATTVLRFRLMDKR